MKIIPHLIFFNLKWKYINLMVKEEFLQYSTLQEVLISKININIFPLMSFHPNYSYFHLHHEFCFRYFSFGSKCHENYFQKNKNVRRLPPSRDAQGLRGGIFNMLFLGEINTLFDKIPIDPKQCFLQYLYCLD